MTTQLNLGEAVQAPASTIQTLFTSAKAHVQVFRTNLSIEKNPKHLLKGSSEVTVITGCERNPGAGPEGLVLLLSLENKNTAHF